MPPKRAPRRARDSARPIPELRPASTRWWLGTIPILVGVALFLFAGGAVPIAAHLEENDAFCASCHTEPEQTFFHRSQSTTAVDLAAKHHQYDTPTRCIDCHSGPGITGRLAAMSVGAGDMVAYMLRTAKQPAVLTEPIADANCLKCHSDTPATRDFDQHFHAYLAKWQAIDPSAAHCTDCHSAHSTDGEPGLSFLQRQRTEMICQRCHQANGVEGD